MSEEIKTVADGVKITGKIPPKFQQIMKMNRGQKPAGDTGLGQARAQGSATLEGLVAGAREKALYEEVRLPSMGVFYNGKDGPTNGVLHIRPMCGEEEQILATPNYVRKGHAMNMIFQRCLQEQYKPENFLSVDLNLLLIWLRGISYSHNYEVELKCPACDHKFAYTLNLNDCVINECPADFRPPLEGVLPRSRYKFAYRLSRGRDETAIQEWQNKQAERWGGRGANESLLYRTASLVEHIEGLTDKTELLVLLKQLPIQDVAELRNLTSDPPFGVETKFTVDCLGCTRDFDIDLPLESSFFFPRSRKTTAQEGPVDQDSGTT